MNISTMSDDVTSKILNEQPHQKQMRFLFLSFYIVLMIVDLWLMISLTHYGIRTKKWRRLEPGNPNLLSSKPVFPNLFWWRTNSKLAKVFSDSKRNNKGHFTQSMVS